MVHKKCTLRISISYSIGSIPISRYVAATRVDQGVSKTDLKYKRRLLQLTDIIFGQFGPGLTVIYEPGQIN